MAKKEYIERPIIPGKEDLYIGAPQIFETRGKGLDKPGKNTKAQGGKKFEIEQGIDELTYKAYDNIVVRDDEGNITYRDETQAEIGE
jgi:hypothetical protein